ncbi:MAG: hypothetical protein QXX95_00170 [Nitrososphaerales archaeon]
MVIGDIIDVREKLISLGLTLLVLGATLGFLTEYKIPHTIIVGKEVKKDEPIFEDEFKVHPGIEVVYFNKFEVGTTLNVNFTTKGNKAINFRVLDDENRELESLGMEPKEYVMKKERLVSMGIIWTPPTDKLLHFVFSNPDKEVKEVKFSLKRVFKERVEEEKVVDSPLIPRDYLSLSLIFVLAGVALASYGTFEILRKIGKNQ